ncbi:succinoglycan biosynthesis transport protein ExoP [Bradyrhizobium sp. AZCC 2262]|uniref:polysaccharide biosynthesis tyrosine autokinase n=1 Tax=Bradyrhizobium sp. AZCC 2262 TaxID=3117022 RepID=UPI002FEF6695
MLHVNQNHKLASIEREFSGPPAISPAQYLDIALGFLRRQFWVLVIALVVTISTAATYFLVAAPMYKATASVSIDTAKFQLFQPAGELSIESSAAVESQLEILRSEKIALDVIKRLNLVDQPPAQSGGLFGSSTPPSTFEYTRQMVAVLQKHLTIKRLGAAWIIEISYEASDGERAAQFANAFADAYIADQLDAKYQTTRQASGWLEGRVKEIREQTLAAQRAVVEFKAKNNIVDTGGRLMSDQQLSEINSQLGTARGQTSEAKARLDRVSAIVQSATASGNANVMVTDVLINETIGKQRSQLLELLSRESDWSAKFGQNNQAVVNLRNQIAQVRSAMLDELRRLGESSKSDYELALRKEKNLETQVAQSISQSETSNRAQVTLRELEGSAAALKDLYDNLNKRYMESVEQKSFPVTEARVISRASRPLDKEYKSKLKVLAAIFGGGISLGFGFSVLRELTDRVFRTVGQVEKRLQMNCITVVPLWKGDEVVNSDTSRSPDGTRQIVRTEGPAWAGTDSPLSSHAEAMRSVKLAIDLNSNVKGAQVIGLTSSLPKEGKSTIAASLALTMARAGAKVMLLDFDLRNPTITRMLAPNAGDGFLDVISGKMRLADAVWTDETKNLTFLPTVIKTMFVQSNEIMASQVTRVFLEKLRSEYNYVVVDLPPLAPVVDTRATTHLIDSYLFVVEWGNTKIDVVEHALSRAPGVSENVLGVILNKVDMNQIDKYDIENRGYYNNEHYAQYGYTQA